jgi:hypothetical protein
MRFRIQITAAALAMASLPLAGCKEKAAYTKIEPAHVEHKEGQEISKVTLTEKAVERIAVETTPVREGKVQGDQAAQPRPFVPHSAIMYLAKGDAFVYTNPAPRTYVRQPVQVDYIEGDVAVLKDGPKPGTQVVSVGAAELYGAEFGVGH